MTILFGGRTQTRRGTLGQFAADGANEEFGLDELIRGNLLKIKSGVIPMPSWEAASSGFAQEGEWPDTGGSGSAGGN
jgi:hypothetical protein